jgi:hypothetical protein
MGDRPLFLQEIEHQMQDPFFFETTLLKTHSLPATVELFLQCDPVISKI